MSRFVLNMLKWGKSGVDPQNIFRSLSYRYIYNNFVHKSDDFKVKVLFDFSYQNKY